MESNKIYTLNNTKLTDEIEWAIHDYINDITRMENDTRWSIQAVQSTDLENEEEYKCIVDLNGEERYIQHIPLINVYNDLKLKQEEIERKIEILYDIFRSPRKYKDEWIQTNENIQTT